MRRARRWNDAAAGLRATATLHERAAATLRNELLHRSEFRARLLAPAHFFPQVAMVATVPIARLATVSTPTAFVRPSVVGGVTPGAGGAPLGR